MRKMMGVALNETPCGMQGEKKIGFIYLLVWFLHWFPSKKDHKAARSKKIKRKYIKYSKKDNK